MTEIIANIDRLNQQLCHQPQAVECYLDLADCYKKLNLHTAAIRVLEYAVGLSPNDPILYREMIALLESSHRN